MLRPAGQAGSAALTFWSAENARAAGLTVVCVGQQRKRVLWRAKLRALPTLRHAARDSARAEAAFSRAAARAYSLYVQLLEGAEAAPLKVAGTTRRRGRCGVYRVRSCWPPQNALFASPARQTVALETKSAAREWRCKRSALRRSLAVGVLVSTLAARNVDTVMTGAIARN